MCCLEHNISSPKFHPHNISSSHHVIPMMFKHHCVIPIKLNFPLNLFGMMITEVKSNKLNKLEKFILLPNNKYLGWLGYILYILSFVANKLEKFKTKYFSDFLFRKNISKTHKKYLSKHILTRMFLHYSIT